METTRPKIIIADDHSLVAEACKKLLEAEYDVVATVGDGRALVRAASTLKPQLIIVDVAMPLLNGLDAGQQIKQMLPSVKLVYLTMSQDADMAAEAFRRGASAYLLKTCAASELTVAVREVLKGRSYLSPAIVSDISLAIASDISPAIASHTVDFLLRQGKVLVEEGDRLTERQREVLQLLAEGKSMKEIASVLNLTPRTVAFLKYRIMEALHVHTNAELVRYASKIHSVSDAESRQKNLGLTPRELVIVSAVAAGYPDKEIAEFLKIGEDTFKHHLNNIFDKLGVSTRLELALWVVRNLTDGGREDADEAGIAVKRPKSPNLNSGSAAASLDDVFDDRAGTSYEGAPTIRSRNRGELPLQ
jgi:DNA-binding NarL/FixJ family response regulator